VRAANASKNILWTNFLQKCNDSAQSTIREGFGRAGARNYHGIHFKYGVCTELHLYQKNRKALSGSEFTIDHHLLKDIANPWSAMRNVDAWTGLTIGTDRRKGRALSAS
jgi:hypothetical protein